ncbi:glycosyltransferase 87 family protein [Micromonospora parathelypteridis]|uniref:Alpha-1,2-mannosyltransferase n=1 Tax=Micromonospora parathelypteridis TaxID=1839617 RepID=A0A840VFL0_9ACTN|nr:glycosyltransferase 87 family protein [Micromonospora parathelypteridis]MBB5475557.1 alpha-1,2-mannosyltransferase [Micromonospora parathelypteridis]GGO27723.1 membrane protein [Micromonospora parathelypteridis]
MNVTRQRVVTVLGLAAVLAVAIAVLPGHRGWFDVGVYHGAVGNWARGGDLYAWSTANGYGFTYPPFAAASMLPMAALAWYPTIVANLVLTALAVAFLLHLLVEPLARRHGWSRWYALALACCLLAGLNPVRDTVSFGQVNLLLLGLVYLDLWLLERGSRLAGVGTGLAAAVKLTPAIFIGYLLVTGRWRAATTAIGTAVGATMVAAVFAPNATRTFFTEALWDTDRVGELAYVSNQSLLGLVARLDPAHPDRRLWLVLVAAVLVVWAVRVRRAVHHGDDRAGFALTGVSACLVSPVTWVHHLVWLVPGLVVLAASTLPWPPADATTRRRARAGVAGYVVLCSGLVWVFANGSAGPLGFVGANAYVWVSIGMLVLLPVGAVPPRTARPAVQCVAGGILCSYWKTLCGSYSALILRSRSKLRPQ